MVESTQQTLSDNDSDVPANMKRFIPLGQLSFTFSKHFTDPRLENNPEVMSHLLHQLGLSPAIGFHDVFSIDDPELLTFVPRPAFALLLVFPVSDTYSRFRQREDDGKPEYTGSGPGEEVMWFKQTIGNACGLIGLLHAASNGPVRKFIGMFLYEHSGEERGSLIAIASRHRL